MWLGQHSTDRIPSGTLERGQGGSVNQKDADNPTKRRAGFVGSEAERSRALRAILAGLWKFVRKRLAVPDMDGNISVWICQLHGIDRFAADGDGTVVPPVVAKIGELLATFGPELDPKEMSAIQDRGEALQRESSFQNMIAAGKNPSSIEFNNSFEEVMRIALDPWQPNLPLEDLSFKGICQSRRAVRATMIALAFHDAHPLTLIARSWKGDKQAAKGDKQAALELVRIDKLFLHDPATAAVIRTAGFQNDQHFINALAAAQKTEPRLRRRDLIRLYMHVLFALELLGSALPRIDELQRLLDPTGTIYEGAYAFERDLQRRRDRFRQMFMEADEETATILSFYRATTSNKP
jgi:hypothetical protein